MTPLASDIYEKIDRALAEDLGVGDATTDALIPPDLQGKAVVVPRAEGVLAGVDIALAVFRRVDGELRATALLPDGSALTPIDERSGLEGDIVAEIGGRVSSILKAERTALNFLQHMSGVATETRRYAKAVEGHPACILDTRKTVPGLRSLEKYAVGVGGGRNHRQGLGDGILIKDNHIQALRATGVQLCEIIARARAGAAHTLKIEVEVENLSEVREALDSEADVLLLDNMGVEEMAEAVELARGRALTEASGGISIETVRSVAATGVDFISVGALTHSAKALDMSLELL